MNNAPLLEDLRVFCLVVRASGFAAAADALGASPAFVSKRVRTLEQSLGVKLLHRTTRRIALSQDGERVYRWAQKILGDVERMVDDVSATRLIPRGLLRLSSSFGFGRNHVAPAIAELASRYPELEIRLDVTDRLMDLASESIDLDIRVGNTIAPDLIARKLATNRRILCAAPAYLAGRGTPQSLEELTRHNCLVIKERDHPFGVWTLEGPEGEANVKVSGPLAANNGEIVHEWALAGHGIMLRSLWDVASNLDAGRLTQVLPDYGQSADVWAVHPVRLSGSAKLRVCVEFMQAYFARLSPQ